MLVSISYTAFEFVVCYPEYYLNWLSCTTGFESLLCPRQRGNRKNKGRTSWWSDRQGQQDHVVRSIVEVRSKLYSDIEGIPLCEVNERVREDFQEEGASPHLRPHTSAPLPSQFTSNSIYWELTPYQALSKAYNIHYLKQLPPHELGNISIWFYRWGNYA